MIIGQPQIIQETDDYAVIFKPPKMHSEPLNNAKKNGDTLTEWYARGDIMHRLDYETHGLVLFAKNKKSFEFFKNLQDKGGFIKEYSAITKKITEPYTQADGFPPPPCIDLNTTPKTIMSYFRPYGHGRKLVRPVINEKTKKEVAKDKGGFYRTEIVSVKDNVFTVRIKRGFRHQIRCHLSWIGYPILNDPLYNSTRQNANEDILALRAHALYFTDPLNGEELECKIPALR